LAIHPTAVVNSKAELASDIEVGPYCVIDGNVRIAAGCRLYQGVYVTGWTQIGERCVLHPGVIVGHAPQDTKYKGERSYCRIGHGAVLREYVTIHRGTVPESTTIVGENCFLLAGCHVGHNCVIGDNVTLINNAQLAGYVRVGDRATLGGQAAVHQFVRIGELAMVAGLARIPMDIVPFALTDVEGRVAGPNSVGLRRSNMPREHLLDIRQAFRILFQTGVSRKEAIARVASSVASPPGRRLVAFLREDSKRGLAGRFRRKVSTSDAASS